MPQDRYTNMSSLCCTLQGAHGRHALSARRKLFYALRSIQTERPVETRRMRATLKAQINKTDRNDARGGRCPGHSLPERSAADAP